MALSQGLSQKLQQKLSPQQIQLMKLLQVPTALLEERIKEEIEENPALEFGDENKDEAQDELEVDSLDADPNESSDEQDDAIDLYDDEDEIADYRLKDDHVPELQDSGIIPHPVSSSLHEMLTEQLGLLNLNEIDSKIAEQIIDALRDYRSGFRELQL